MMVTGVVRAVGRPRLRARSAVDDLKGAVDRGAAPHMPAAVLWRRRIRETCSIRVAGATGVMPDRAALRTVRGPSVRATPNFRRGRDIHRDRERNSHGSLFSIPPSAS